MSTQIVKGAWLMLPLGSVAEVRSVKTIKLPRRDGDKAPRFATEVELRYVDAGGVMAPSGFWVTLDFCNLRCRIVDVARAATAAHGAIKPKREATA